ncbi:hypothetical protein Y032_0089g2224 [Ancylostoma ceylanicum]|uniref:Uncharacterized protein n=1 Tax=Ancylostoma ceylanicum TaxID=53326 RepID=A0A016TN50_9BILA|nr:hypothetical protein Y032_0089g2224 [Ancylostoma ceylanicum]
MKKSIYADGGANLNNMFCHRAADVLQSISGNGGAPPYVSKGRKCARVPPRNHVNGTNCTYPLRQTTHCDSVNWRVEPLKARRVRDSDSCFSTGGSSFLVFFSHVQCGHSLFNHSHLSSESRISAGAAFKWRKTCPCIAFGNNSKLSSIWIPELREIIYEEQPVDVPVIALQGDALELDDSDVEMFTNLSGGSLVIVDKVFVGKSENMFDPDLFFLDADTVLAVLCFVLALFFVSYLGITVKLFLRGVNLEKHETDIVKGMLGVRSVNMGAKTHRLAVRLTPDFQTFPCARFVRMTLPLGTVLSLSRVE